MALSTFINKLLWEQGCPTPAIRGGACCCTWTKQEFMEVKTKKWALQYIHDNMSKWHIDCWALHTKWYPSVRIDEENPSYTWSCEQFKWRSMWKQNRRWTSTSCWDCNACMIICLKGMYIAFAGHCTQSGTHQWGSTKKIQVKHDLGRRYIYGGQGQHKIGGAHLGHVGIAMHAWLFVEKAKFLLGAARKVVPLKRDGRTDGQTDGRTDNPET